MNKIWFIAYFLLLSLITWLIHPDALFNPDHIIIRFLLAFIVIFCKIQIKLKMLGKDE